VRLDEWQRVLDSQFLEEGAEEGAKSPPVAQPTAPPPEDVPTGAVPSDSSPDDTAEPGKEECTEIVGGDPPPLSAETDILAEAAPQFADEPVSAAIEPTGLPPEYEQVESKTVVVYEAVADIVLLPADLEDQADAAASSVPALAQIQTGNDASQTDAPVLADSEPAVRKTYDAEPAQDHASRPESSAPGPYKAEPSEIGTPSLADYISARRGRADSPAVQLQFEPLVTTEEADSGAHPPDSAAASPAATEQSVDTLIYPLLASDLIYERLRPTNGEPLVKEAVQQNKRREALARRLLNPALTHEETALFLDVSPAAVLSFMERGVLTPVEAPRSAGSLNGAGGEGTEPRMFRLSEVVRFLTADVHVPEAKPTNADGPDASRAD